MIIAYSLISFILGGVLVGALCYIYFNKTKEFRETSIQTLNILLDPLKDKLKDFEKKIDEAYSQERFERGTLKGELSKLLELNLKMSSEAQSLTRALKGDVKSQGAWGELILENILERSGLRKNEEYVLQGSEMSLRNDEGKTIKPDVIINLPDNKHLIVDAKVSLTAYQSYVHEENNLQREIFGKAHIESLKRHIDGLSEKKYYSSEKLLTPDFVILFLPVEPAFALAFKLKPDLFNYAWEKNIAIVSPTTLLTTLRTVATLWKQERQQKNALEIAQRGGILYDKFVAFVKDLENVKEKLDMAQKALGAAVGKLSEGSGNLIRQAEMLKELGVKTDKKLNQTSAEKSLSPLD